MACPPTVCDIVEYPTYCAYNPFGPDANCTLDVCCPEYSVYAYIPELAPNTIFITLFTMAAFLYYQTGLVRNHWWFTGCMVAGCIDEVLGYTGRVMMYNDLWGFKGFMMQVVCVTTAPVFFCAAIYVLLAKTVSTFGSAFSRFNPALFYWVFIPCDILSLALQGAGGALSSLSSGKNDSGVGLALTGLALQVVTLVIFCGLYCDYLWRFFKSEQFRERAIRRPSFGPRLKLFFASVSLAIVAILVRCVFRLHELKEGYKPSNEMLRQEGLFIGLEGVPMILAVFFLSISHPGFMNGVVTRSPIASSSKEIELEGMAERAAERPAGELAHV